MPIHSRVHVWPVCGILASVVITALCATEPAQMLPLVRNNVGATKHIDEVIDIVAAEGEKAWLIDMDTDKIAKDSVITRIYLEPNVQTPFLRRGKLFLGTKLREPSGNVRVPFTWYGLFESEPREYAQVAVTNQLFREHLYEMPSRLTEPFRVYGHISDEDIVNSVMFIRTSPKKERHRSERLRDGSRRIRGGSDFASIRGECRILSIAMQENGSVEIHTLSTTHGGQVIVLVKKEDHWVVDSVGSWSA